ncbi:MAG TPA: phage tail protein I [Candidatus Acidoferrum sp.]|nr:phage tail protein I [Candidatus Acidoferrum sp.]
MSCGTGKPNFQLLDCNVGWAEPDPAKTNLDGFGDCDGLRLLLKNPSAIDPSAITACIPPARLARGCGSCEWFLVTKSPPCSRLLKRDACHHEWGELWTSKFTPIQLVDAVAIATWRRYVAVADRAVGRVYLLSASGLRLVAQVSFDNPAAVAFSSTGELFVASSSKSQIFRFGLDGNLRGILQGPVATGINRIAVDRTTRLWVVSVDAGGTWQLWSAAICDGIFRSETIASLQGAFPPSGVSAESPEGFCLNDTSGGSVGCFSWYGRPIPADEIIPAPPPAVQSQGQLLTSALDSGIPRCKWHRVRLDADVPSGTSLEISVATTEDKNIQAQGSLGGDPQWQTFPSGAPHPSDWTIAAPGFLDFLIQQPPGRYLYLRIRFRSSDGISTPIVRRVRIDFPRTTSIEHLPDIYRQNPKAEEFTERFLSLFDALLSDTDNLITGYPALLDPTGVPDQLLPWLAKFFSISLDPTWNADTSRKVIQSAAKLYRERGTPAGLRDAIQLVFGISPAILESSPVGPWGAVGTGNSHKTCGCTGSQSASSIRRTAKLGSVRLFGKTKVRFRLGSSPLSGAPLRSYGNPDLDPFADGSYRFRVLVPPLADTSEQTKERLQYLVEAQKPAHTIASIRFGGTGFLLGHWSAVGIDTAFVALPSPILGASGNIRLRRTSILWGSQQTPNTGMKLGTRSIVGIQTIAG